MAVIIVPGLFVLITAIPRCNFFKRRRYIIIYKPRLIFSRRNPCRRTNVKDSNYSVFNVRFTNCRGNMLCYINNVTVTICFNF